MPMIAIVDGVKILMFYNDHAPPHFHAVIGDDKVLISIRDFGTLEGSLPPAKLRRVLPWARDHQGASVLNWNKCQDEQQPDRI